MCGFLHSKREYQTPGPVIPVEATKWGNLTCARRRNLEFLGAPHIHFGLHTQKGHRLGDEAHPAAIIGRERPSSPGSPTKIGWILPAGWPAPCVSSTPGCLLSAKVFLPKERVHQRGTFPFLSFSPTFCCPSVLLPCCQSSSCGGIDVHWTEEFIAHFCTFLP